MDRKGVFFVKKIGSGRVALLGLVSALAISQFVTVSPSLAAEAPSNAAQSKTSRNGRISGVVVRPSGGYVAGAQVQVDSSNATVQTDSSGEFKIDNVPAGAHNVTVTYFGSPNQTSSVDVSSGSTATLRVVVPEGAEAATIETVVVSAKPIAESEAAALQFKRASNQLVDVIAADSIGRFPDQNVAAALGRLPGVGVQRDQGQERYISLRGAPNNWTTLAFDGVNVISPEGRTARFDTIPSAIASRIVVKKAVTAEMSGETLAGNIDIVTRSPFDYPDTKISLDAAGGYNELGGGAQYNFAGFFSTRFADDKMGILISASRYQRDMVTDNFEIDWEHADQDQQPGHDDRIWASKYQNKLYRLTRSNTAFSGKYEWQPSSDTTLFLSSIYTQFQDDELRNAWVFDIDQDSKSTATSKVGTTTGFADVRTGNTPTSGVIHGAEIESTEHSNVSIQSIWTNTLGGDHNWDSWRAKWRLNFTRADDISHQHFDSSWKSPSAFTSRPTFAYDFSSPDQPRISLYDTVANKDGTYSTGAARPGISTTELNLIDFLRDRERDRTEAHTAKFDIDHDAQIFGLDTTIRVGGEYDRRTKTANDVVLETTPAELKAKGLAVPTMADFAINDPYKGKLPLGYTFSYFSAEKGNALEDKYLAAGAFDIQPDTSEQNNYKVSEAIFAGYAMATTSFDWGNVVYGVRVEHTDNKGSALAEGDSGYTPVSVSSGQTLVFPSVHFNWNVNDEMKMRLSFNTGAARPDYGDLRPNFTYDDGDQVISGGNPNAKPERAKGVDLYYEWYMPSRGYLSAGAYYKELSDVLFDIELTQFDSDVLNSPGVDRSTYRFQTIDNGGSGTIKGIELAYSQPLEDVVRSLGLPEWAQGFGVQTNATFNQSRAKTPDGRAVPLPGASNFLFNASGYYEMYGFSARVSYEYRTKWLDSLGDDVGDEYWASNGRISAALRYRLNPTLEFYLDADNLTDEPGLRFVGDTKHPIEHETFGRRYLAGVRVDL